MIKIAVLTDDIPLKDSLFASGMQRVNTRLFRALSHNLDLIIAVNSGAVYKKRDVAEDLQHKSELVSFPRLAVKSIGRFFPILKNSDRIFSRKIKGFARHLQKSKIDWLFCPCGSDPNSLGRGLALSEASGLPLAVYLVDDFLAGAQLSENKNHLELAESSVPKWLERVDQIFVITEGLQSRIKSLYGLDSTVLNLPYELPSQAIKVINSSSLQIIFVGSLSHFYIDGLRQIASVIDDINNYRSQKISLRLTSSNLSQARNLIGEFDCLVVKSCSTTEDLYQEIASSLICFAPYSFDLKYKEMVASSFPSKMMDYLSVGKFILNYSPDHATSGKYFCANKIPHLVNIEDPNLLRQAIENQLKCRRDWSDLYQSIVLEKHSYSEISNTILSSLLEIQLS
jgi:hypothetical protein